MQRMTSHFQKLLFASGLGLALTSTGLAQNNKALSKLNNVESRMSSAQRDLVSAGGRNMLHVARDFSGARHIAPTFASRQKAHLLATAPKPLIAAHEGEPTPISDPQLDLQLSRLSGFTQSESSTAWCGNSVVTGYNDSAAFLQTAVAGGGASFSGVSASNDGGRTFRDIGTVNPGLDPNIFLGGDPVVVCANPSTFFYASLLSAVDVDGNGLTGISLNASTDGGNTWSLPTAAILKTDDHFLDKDWLAIDPTNPNRLYVTYTDFDGSLEAAQGCHFGISLPRVAIELVTSNDGGQTWSAPSVVFQVHCGSGGEAVQGSSIVIGPNGEVNVAFEHRLPDSIEILFARSTDHGTTFQPPVTIAASDFAGIFQGYAQDFFRINSFPMLAVDRSSTASRGTLYLTWSGPNGSVPDFTSFTGFYNFGGTFISRSSDGGNSWTTPSLVSPLAAAVHGPGVDQLFPSAAVDRSGALAVCYYDRRNDPTNSALDRYCSFSSDQGSSFHDARETTRSWIPTHDADLVINPTYMGDYDTVVSDSTGHSTGFFDSFQVQTGFNADVVGVLHQTHHED